MKPFFPTYLYVKTHKTTGLKYFGKTTKKDPHLYRGSGIYWIRHCNEHGWNYSTKILGFFEDKEECTEFALNFSKKHKIVTKTRNGKKVWANHIEENGLDGGYTGPRVYSEEARKKISLAHKGRIVSEETRAKLSKAFKGKKFTDEQKENCRQAQLKPETIEKKRNAILGRKHSKALIEKRKFAVKAAWDKKSPEEKKLIGEKISKGHRLRIDSMSPQDREKLRISNSNKNKGRKASEETKQKIREARAKQIFSDETKKKLSGSMVVVSRVGNIKKIPLEQFYKQRKKLKPENSYWVTHSSLEGKRRLELKRSTIE